MQLQVQTGNQRKTKTNGNGKITGGKKRIEKNTKQVRGLPSEIVEATEDRRMCLLFSPLAADHPALPTLLQVGSNF